MYDCRYWTETKEYGTGSSFGFDMAKVLMLLVQAEVYYTHTGGGDDDDDHDENCCCCLFPPHSVRVLCSILVCVYTCVVVVMAASALYAHPGGERRDCVTATVPLLAATVVMVCELECERQLYY